ncbi:MAG: response regulator transcription factor [Chloroflexota bacterium]|nr:response regulator transcription factor [Chloroflexota bacterium]
MSPSESITVLIVDDHPLMRKGLRDVLEGSGRFVVVGEAEDGEEALRAAAELKPEVVVMDVIMPRMDGIDACRELMALLPDTRVVMLTAAAQEDAVVDSIAAGASGFLEKYAPPEEFVTAVLDVAAGRLRVPDEAVKRVFAMLRGQRPLESAGPLERLTAIERETLTLFASGTPYGEIARVRGVSVVTVRNTLYRIQDKLGIETKPELVIWAVRNGLVDDIVVGIDEQ